VEIGAETGAEIVETGDRGRLLCRLRKRAFLRQMLRKVR
jgi:hypothetical protein